MIRITTKSSKLRPLRHFARSLCDNTDKPSEAVPAEKKTSSPLKKQTLKPASSNRLNELLASMSTDSNLNIIKEVVTPPKPIKHSEKPTKRKPDSLLDAVQQVATELGGDAKQTESELLTKLLQRRGGSVAATEDQSLGDLISGMKIDRNEGATRTVPPKTRSRADFVRQSMSQSGERSERQEIRPRYPKRQQSDIQQAKISGGSVNLFGEKPLGIFKNVTELKESADILSTWSYLQARELKLAVTHPPSNYFQKMALWTEQGKLWKFPIDNEQGLDVEAKIFFTEHIFLDKHLESWCPSKGPVRHFMELVCVGLSKNPYYTVQQKIDHINWFKQYFDEKKDILQKTIIQQNTSTPTASQTLG